MWQYVITALVVALCVVYAAYRLWLSLSDRRRHDGSDDSSSHSCGGCDDVDCPFRHGR